MLKVDPSVEDQQKKRLAEVKSARDNNAVTQSLAQLGGAAEKNENVMEPVLNAVRHYASLGEICGVLRKVYGEYRQ